VEWWLTLLVIVGSLILLMASRMPVAFCFVLVSLVGSFLFWGEAGLRQLFMSLSDSVATFSLLPLPLFVLMGTAMFRSGIAPLMIDAVDKWMGRLPGRLSLLAVGGGALLSTLTGASASSVAILGSSLVPEMEKRGYKKPMSLGPILGSGGLAIMIPPSGLAVLLGFIAEIDIGKTLVAIIIPGILMAVLYASYIILRCMLQPSIAPVYEVAQVTILEKIMPTVRYVLPIGFITFMVVGVIFLGVATPTEAAATGVIGTFILAAMYGKLNWKMAKESIGDGLWTAAMMLMILAGATGFSQILAFSGASSGMLKFAVGLPLPPIIVVILLQVVVLIMGMFMNPGAIMMVTLPFFMPVIQTLGFNEVWFGVLFLLNIEMATTSPPFGMSLFVMKGVAPPDTTMGDIFRAGLPFLGCDAIAMALIIAFPALALWLPSVMK
jgi:tripartite ATP-independent transporter DctM subunit